MFFVEMMMVHEWSLRDELLATAQRWPVIALFCLIGALAGWLISLFWPSPYRATVELYVGIGLVQSMEDQNARSFSGVDFNFPDDYKNWQMANLSTLAYRDSVLDETLNRLRQADPSWGAVERQTLAKHLHVYWRNAGLWRLVAEHSNGTKAVQAATTWSEVVVEQAHEAIAQAQVTIRLDEQIEAIAASLVKNAEDLGRVSRARQTLDETRAALEKLGGDARVEDVQVDWLKTTLATMEEGSDLKLPVDEMPPAGAPMAEFLSWIDRTQVSFAAQSALLQEQGLALEQQRLPLEEQYPEASRLSLGLSPDFQIEKVTLDPPGVTIIRPTGLLALIGAALGLLAWLVLWLSRISMMNRPASAPFSGSAK